MRKSLSSDRSWQPLYEIAMQPRFEYEIVVKPVGWFKIRWKQISDVYAVQRPTKESMVGRSGL